MYNLFLYSFPFTMIFFPVGPICRPVHYSPAMAPPWLPTNTPCPLGSSSNSWYPSGPLPTTYSNKPQNPFETAHHSYQNSHHGPYFGFPPTPPSESTHHGAPSSDGPVTGAYEGNRGLSGNVHYPPQHYQTYAGQESLSAQGKAFK